MRRLDTISLPGRVTLPTERMTFWQLSTPIPHPPSYGHHITTLPTDQQTDTVHHTVYVMPASGMLFANDHASSSRGEALFTCRRRLFLLLFVVSHFIDPFLNAGIGISSFSVCASTDVGRSGLLAPG